MSVSKIFDFGMILEFLRLDDCNLVWLVYRNILVFTLLLLSWTERPEKRKWKIIRQRQRKEEKKKRGKADDKNKR